MSGRTPKSRHCGRRQSKPSHAKSVSPGLSNAEARFNQYREVVTMAYAEQSDAEYRRETVKVAFASFVGTTIEWYDYFLFGTASALVFNKLFFPEFDPMVGTMLALMTFAIGFIARPFGGIVFGHFGDKIGRKRMLFLTLIIMGAGTFFVGLCPTYNQIGIWAPIILVTMRILQGFALGGEWGGAVLMAVEHAPEG